MLVDEQKFKEFCDTNYYLRDYNLFLDSNNLQDLLNSVTNNIKQISESNMKNILNTVISNISLLEYARIINLLTGAMYNKTQNLKYKLAQGEIINSLKNVI